LLTLIKSLATPIVLIITILILGFRISIKYQGNQKATVGIYLQLIGICILYFLSIKPVSNILISSLENQYMPPSEKILQNLDIIVVLGGGVTADPYNKAVEASGATYSRIFNGVKIFQRSGASVLILSGGSEKSTSSPESAVMKEIALSLGVIEESVITEENSHNTSQHPKKIAEILHSLDPSTQIGVVTSAVHMVRAIRAFEKEFTTNKIIPIPVGYLQTSFRLEINNCIPRSDAFIMSSSVIHEYFGLIWGEII